jgi:hypothetical protein
LGEAAARRPTDAVLVKRASGAVAGAVVWQHPLVVADVGGSRPVGRLKPLRFPAAQLAKCRDVLCRMGFGFVVLYRNLAWRLGQVKWGDQAEPRQFLGLRNRESAQSRQTDVLPGRSRTNRPPGHEGRAAKAFQPGEVQRRRGRRPANHPDKKCVGNLRIRPPQQEQKGHPGFSRKRPSRLFEDSARTRGEADHP